MVEKLLRARELAALTGIPKTTVYAMAASGQLPCLRYGVRAVRFSESAIQRWIEQRTEGGGQAATDAGAR